MSRSHFAHETDRASLARWSSSALPLFAIAVLLTACGGGGGASAPAPQCGGSTAFLTDIGIRLPPTTGTYTYNTFMPGAAGFPALGGTYTDPVFGGIVRRLTNLVGTVNFDNIYAHHWANANGTFAFTYGPTIVEVATGRTVYSSQPAGLNGSELYWDALDPDKYYFFSGASLMRRNLSAQTNTTMKTFPATLQANGGSVNIQSGNGRYFTVRYGGANQVWDSQLDVIYAGSVVPTSAGGWVGISPNGNYIINAGSPQHYSQFIDHTTQTISPTQVMFWNLCGDHGDTVSASNGKTYLITMNCNNIPAVYRVDITLDQAGKSAAQQAAANQLLVPTTWNDDSHFSAVSRGAFADWVFISTESNADAFNSSVSGWTAYKQEIIAANVITLEVRRFAHHRSRNLPVQYGTSPRVSSSWDGSTVMWTSDFNISSPTGYADTYAIQSPLGSTGATVPAPQNLQVR